MTGKRRSLAANSFFSVIAWLFPILLGFISTPILVRNLGNEHYGIFALVLGFISYSFTFGVGKVAGKYVPEYQAAGLPEKVTQVISATFWFSLAIGVAGSLLLVLAAPVIVDDLLLVSVDDRMTAIYSLYLAGAIGLFVMLSQVFQFVLQGLHRFDSYVALTNLNGLMLGIGNIVLAVTGFGVPALLSWNLAVTTFTGLLFYVKAKDLLPSIDLAPRVPRGALRGEHHPLSGVRKSSVYLRTLVGSAKVRGGRLDAVFCPDATRDIHARVSFQCHAGGFSGRK